MIHESNNCPHCGKPMTWRMMYIAGEPQVYWNCTCGFSTLKIQQKYNVSNKTEMIEGKHAKWSNQTQSL